MKYECKYCKRSFATKQQKEEHELIHENKKYQCNICDKYYSNISNLCRHKSKAHEKQKDQSTTTSFSVDGREFLCGDCSQRFSIQNQADYNSHLDEHYKRSDYGTLKYATKKWHKMI